LTLRPYIDLVNGRLNAIAIKPGRPRHRETQIIASYSVSHKTEHA